jgi:hypothetical protein
MESGGSQRSRLLTAGGILSIIVGIYQIVGGLFLAGIIPPSLPFPDFFLDLQLRIFFVLSLLLAFPLGDLGGAFWYGLMGTTVPEFLISICNPVLGTIAVVGGISAIKRKWFSISLAGAIGALFTVPLGILAVIFVVLGKRGFKAKEMDAEVV